MKNIFRDHPRRRHAKKKIHTSNDQFIVSDNQLRATPHHQDLDPGQVSG